MNKHLTVTLLKSVIFYLPIYFILLFIHIFILEKLVYIRFLIGGLIIIDNFLLSNIFSSLVTSYLLIKRESPHPFKTVFIITFIHLLILMLTNPYLQELISLNPIAITIQINYLIVLIQLPLIVLLMKSFLGTQKKSLQDLNDDKIESNNNRLKVPLPLGLKIAALYLIISGVVGLICSLFEVGPYHPRFEMLSSSSDSSQTGKMFSDEEMIQTFKVNRNLFYKIVVKFLYQESIEDISIKDNTEYSMAMSKLNIIRMTKKGFIRYPSVFLCVNFLEFDGGGAIKGYFYVRDEIYRNFFESYSNMLVNDLDDYFKNNRDHIAFRKLEGNCFLFLYCWYDG